jgi:hypothetical protein
MANLQTNISPKVTGAALGAALASILWTLLSALVLDGMDPEEIAAVTSGTATLFAFAFGYLLTDPAREPGTPSTEVVANGKTGTRQAAARR